MRRTPAVAVITRPAMAPRGPTLAALLVACSSLAVVSASAGTHPDSPIPPVGAPSAESVFDCKRCCATTGRPCHALCPPCAPDAFNPCSVVRCPGPGPCVVRDGKAVCVGADDGDCPIEADLLHLNNLRCSRSSCSSDSDCASKQKCCRHGRCGHHCSPGCFPSCASGQQCRIDQRPPVCLGSYCPPARLPTASCRPDPDAPQPGLAQCPQVDPATLAAISCAAPPQHQCNSDAECSSDGSRRCCDAECARRCVPTCSPPCAGGRICRLGSQPTSCLGPGCPRPVDTATCVLPPAADPCAATLCQVGTRCEIQNGVGVCVPVGGKVCPKHERTAQCLLLRDQCQSDAQCGAKEKCCQQDCGRQCVSACPAPCGPGEECVLEHFATCLAIGCPPPPPPRAVCKPRTPTVPPPTPPAVREGRCPRDTLITTCEVRPDACFSDSVCPSGQRCCSRGCGRACTPVCQNCEGEQKECVLEQVQCIRAPCPPLPVCKPRTPTVPPPTPPAVREGRCPRDTLITTCEVRPDACFSDGECPSGQRCCSRGCGRTCTPVCRNCEGKHRECVLQQVQCFRAPCPPIAVCRRRRYN